jgi:hypothetical protein
VCLLALGLPIAPPEADLPALPPAGAAGARRGALGALRSPAAGAEAGGAGAMRQRRRADEDADFAAGTSTGEDEGEDEGLGTPAGGAPEEEEGDSCLEAAKSRSAPPPAVPANLRAHPSLRAGELVAQLHGRVCRGRRRAGQPTAPMQPSLARASPSCGRARALRMCCKHCMRALRARPARAAGARRGAEAAGAPAAARKKPSVKSRLMKKLRIR